MIFSCCTPVEPSLWQKILPTLIGPSIVLFLFIVGRFLDSTIRLREVKRNWYLKVIIDPNISKLEEFYTNVLSTVRASISILVPLKSSKNFSEYLTEKSLEIGKFQVIKRKFEIEFIALIQTNYPEISNELESLLRDLEDKITACLDKQDLDESHYSTLEIELSSTKYELLKILYKPLTLKRVLFFKRIKLRKS